MRKHYSVKPGLVSLVIALLIIGTACAPYQYQPPDTTGNGWVTASLDEVGLDEKPLA